jgi:Ca2+-binding EF-hand superfamily protein
LNEIISKQAKLDFPSFQNVLKEKLIGVNAASLREDQIRSAFKVFDKNGAGFIDSQTLR